MKTRKLFRKGVALLLVAAMAVALAACGAKGGSRFTGKWKAVSGEAAAGGGTALEFRSDGTATVGGEEMTYVIKEKEGKLELHKGFYYYECGYSFDGSKKPVLTGEYEKVK